ncbi:hypothetical protein VPH35_064332 [Triticum aestivum]
MQSPSAKISLTCGSIGSINQVFVLKTRGENTESFCIKSSEKYALSQFCVHASSYMYFSYICIQILVLQKKARSSLTVIEEIQLYPLQRPRPRPCSSHRALASAVSK